MKIEEINYPEKIWINFGKCEKFWSKFGKNWETENFVGNFLKKVKFGGKN